MVTFSNKYLYLYEKGSKFKACEVKEVFLNALKGGAQWYAFVFEILLAIYQAVHCKHVIK